MFRKSILFHLIAIKSLVIKFIRYVEKREKVQKMEYKRKVDKGRIPTCNIMGVNIIINMEMVSTISQKNLSGNKRGLYLCLKCTYHGNQL